jgi:hypothetical protein
MGQCAGMSLERMGETLRGAVPENNGSEQGSEDRWEPDHSDEALALSDPADLVGCCVSVRW